MRPKGTLSLPLKVATTQLGGENGHSHMYTHTYSGNYLVTKAANAKMPFY